MWGRKRQAVEEAKPEESRPQRLKDALRKARVESAERSGIVVDLHDAEVARLELLNEAIEPLFDEIPAEVDLFDLGISRGETPKLWIDAIAHVAMGRDKRVYRFVQDTRYGRKVLAESVHISEIVQAVTKYLAQRLVERERALADIGTPLVGDLRREARYERRKRRRRAIAIFLLGLFAGAAVLVATALLLGPWP
jgi:predicted metal-dependent RNase